MRTEPIAAALCANLGGQWQLHALGASGFSSTWMAQHGARRLFVKSVDAQSEMLRAEADGLFAIADAAAIRVPHVEWQGPVETRDVLAMEWLDLVPPDRNFGARFGRALGALHRRPCPLRPARFGWPRDNFIGGTPQSNTSSAGEAPADWQDFFATRRLRPMRDRLAARGEPPDLLEAVDRVASGLPRFFDDGHRPRPSLIHGDLWQGNWGMLADGAPVIYDPAVSCADAEMELAMMELFGTPPAGFWPAYRDAAALHPGYARRRPLYQLYHLLNHAVLFGGSYGEQALRCAQGLMA